jgi:hypothetical protein
MAVWTVDAWQIKPGTEAHFLGNCGPLSPGRLVLFRDLEKQGLFWSPEKWGSRDALETWRKGSSFRWAAAQVEEDVLRHVTHIMEDVPGFEPPR